MNRLASSSVVGILSLSVSLMACGADGAQLSSGASGTSDEGSFSTGESSDASGGSTESSAGDGDSGGDTAASDGTTGDGDGSGTTTGDGTTGDGDGATSGDGSTGDGDGTTTGDGDGTSGDGDGDGDGSCNVIDPVTLYLSPDDSNSIASPVLVRERNGGSLSGVHVRPWEFMNYYDFDYPAAAAGELNLDVAMVLEPTVGEYRMQIAVTSETMSPADRPPMKLTLVLDTSGSMSGAPMERQKDVCRQIAGSLKPGDGVSMVEWDIAQSFTLDDHQVSGANDSTLLAACNALTPGGGTNLNGGLTTGYSLATQNFDAGSINRLVLVSDGGANAGVTDIDLIAQNALFGGSDGIYLVGVGVGTGSGYNDTLMNTVTDAGKGGSIYINDLNEAAKIFGDQFENTMAIAARDVQVQLDMPPSFEIKTFSGEEFGGDPTEIEPQHLAPNDSMVFHQVIETCDPDSVTGMSEFTVTARWFDPWTMAPLEVTATYTIDELLAADPALLRKGQAIAEAGEALKAVAGFDSTLLAGAASTIDIALLANPADNDLTELLAVVQAY